MHKYDKIPHVVVHLSSHLFELHSDSAFSIDNTSEFLVSRTLSPSTMASDALSLNEKKGTKFGDSTTDRIEDVSDSAYAEHLANLPGIEATAASKAAWLISITVSLGGLLFGMKTTFLIRKSH